MPKDNITRAIKKGTGELDGGDLEEIVYEGYGPGGVAVMCETLTDNRNRTGPELRPPFPNWAVKSASQDASPTCSIAKVCLSLTADRR